MNEWMNEWGKSARPHGHIAHAQDFGCDAEPQSEREVGVVYWL